MKRSERIYENLSDGEQTLTPPRLLSSTSLNSKHIYENLPDGEPIYANLDSLALLPPPPRAEEPQQYLTMRESPARRAPKPWWWFLRDGDDDEEEEERCSYVSLDPHATLALREVMMETPIPSMTSEEEYGYSMFAAAADKKKKKNWLFKLFSCVVS